MVSVINLVVTFSSTIISALLLWLFSSSSSSLSNVRIIRLGSGCGFLATTVDGVSSSIFRDFICYFYRYYKIMNKIILL